jgi:hypothetical protein
LNPFLTNLHGPHMHDHARPQSLSASAWFHAVFARHALHTQNIRPQRAGSGPLRSNAGALT